MTPPATLRIVTLAILAAALLGPRARADETDDYRRMIESQKTQQEQYATRLKALPGQQKITDVLAVSLEDGRLAFKSPLLTDAAKLGNNRQVRVDVDGFPGFCTVTVQPIGNGSFYFAFTNVQYPDLQGVANLSVNLQPGFFQISRNFNGLRKNANINLVQSNGRAIYGQPDGVQLNVYSGDSTGRNTVSLNLSAPDFVTLRRQHPREVNEHLRPLLRELRLESVFAVDPTTAWQVFVDEWKGNADVAGRVKGLLDQLEGDEYPQRERARQSLRKLGPDAALVIYRMDRTGLTPEQNCQLDTVLAGHSTLSRADAARLLVDVDFLLDCLYSDDAEIRAVALRHLGQVTGKDITIEGADDYNARVTKVEALRAEFSPKSKPPATQRTKR